MFSTPATIAGAWVEEVAPGAYAKTLSEHDIRALWNHDTNIVLGRNKAGTLKLWEDGHGLQTEITPPDNEWGRPVLDAVKRGAFDFCEKPVSDNALVDRVEQALARSAQVLQVQIQRELVGRMLAGLTERELAVMRLMLDGLPNKLIADQLQISVRTVEVHRARVFDKMRVKSAVELANALQHR